VGERKYFYLDWNLDIRRCEAWAEPMGSVFEFGQIPDRRDRCTACKTACYRDTRVLMHAGIAATGAAGALTVGSGGATTDAAQRRPITGRRCAESEAAHPSDLALRPSCSLRAGRYFMDQRDAS